ncbi:MAG: hypothetical protein JXB39_02940 [Deltaproteobacteria bacterium]|nr:hypothetical protein [Deltaproteobacteria bacterium]
MTSTLLLLILGCAPDPDSASIENGDHAPWLFESARSALWTVDPLTDGRLGEALLLLTTEETDCDALTEAFGTDSLAVFGQETGLAFFLSYRLDRASSSDPDWTGFYMGQDYDIGSDGEDQRYVGVLAFRDGVAYILGSDEGGGAWLRVRRADEEVVEGSFYAIHWWGDLSAEVCGPWEDPSTGEE